MKTGKNEIFIIGGGSSLVKFPFYQLRDKDTIAINMAALDVPNPTFCLTADSGIFRKLQDGYFKKVRTTWVVVTNPEHAAMKWKDGKFKHVTSGYVYNLLVPNMIIRNAGTDGIGFTFSDFRTGYNSGFCGFQLAVLLGYKRIYLLGFDLSGGLHKCHYHDRYKGRRIASETLRKFYDNFVLALKVIKQETDIEVISCSASSKLNSVIPYKPFSQISNYQPTPVHKLLQIKNDDHPKALSILICSVVERGLMLNKLLDVLSNQKTKEVEVLVEVDDREITTGEKRNKLLKRAKGEYVAFIDDDDTVSEDYIPKILKAIKSKPDCCGIEGIVTAKAKNRKRKFVHSMRYKSWFEKDGVYFRCPNHISPIRRELALRVQFPHITVGEDKVFSLKLQPLLEKEEYIEGPIYFYMAE